ncbi:unnamed protein product [Ilex paraguariensis]|uniref:NB-ARC domain-containing protein n=1 Tax=Ilex paraguariensis TaxID=185542 RepID=A0ABC8QMS2_9AQUA
MYELRLEKEIGKEIVKKCGCIPLAIKAIAEDHEINTEQLVRSLLVGVGHGKVSQVLDLSHIKLDKITIRDLWHWITSQKHLAYLNLRNVTKLVELPDSIGKIWGLHILILGECKNLKKLSALITSIPKLTVLDMGNCPLLQCLPQGLLRLSNLQELYGFKITSLTDVEGCHLGEPRGLSSLLVMQMEIKEEIH